MFLYIILLYDASGEAHIHNTDIGEIRCRCSFLRLIMRTALLIDGGHLRAVFKNFKARYTVDGVQKFAQSCFSNTDDIHRIFYYDAPPYSENIITPISQISKPPIKNNFLDDLAMRERFAVRRGRLAFRGWKLKKERHGARDEAELADNHFRPDFEQKGVDMRIGLDIAKMSHRTDVRRLILVSADTDMEPALKYARIEGLEVITMKLIGLPKRMWLHKTLISNSDVVREIKLRDFFREIESG